MATESAIAWRTSSYSQSNGACVELTGSLNMVRDTKNREGGTLAVDLRPLITGIKAGHFTR